jgi:hypothetical protein
MQNREPEDITEETRKINTLQAQALHLFGHNSRVYITLFGIQPQMRLYVIDTQKFLEQMIEGRIALPDGCEQDKIRRFYARFCREYELVDKYVTNEPAEAQKQSAEQR